MNNSWPRAKAEHQWDLQPRRVRPVERGGGHQGEAARPHRRRGHARAGHGEDPGRSARHEAADGLLVSLRRHVRGAVHPHVVGDRHARGPLHLAGRAWRSSPAKQSARPRNVLDPQRDGQRRRVRDVGISVVSLRVRRAVGDDGHRQPTAGGHRAGPRNHVSADARAEANLRPMHRRFRS